MTDQTIFYKGFTCVLEKKPFAKGGFRLGLNDVTGEQIDILNVWLPGLADNEVALDVNNCGNEVIGVLMEAKVIKPLHLRSIVSGFCRYPVYELTDWQSGDAWTTMLLIDGEDRVSLYDFMRDNWAPNVEHLSEQDMRQLFSLQIGEGTKVGLFNIQRIG